MPKATRLPAYLFPLFGVLCLHACHRSRLPQTTEAPTHAGRVAVMLFSAQSATMENYAGARDFVGENVAAAVAAGLGRRGSTAQTVRDEVPAAAELIVSGRVTRIDGGSQTKRAILGMGAGHATFAVEGEVRRRDGTVVGTFSDERGSIGRVGYGGGSNEFVVGLCIERVGDDVAEMVATGHYSGGGPIVQTQPAPAAGSARPVSERLRELDALREQGLLTEKEYQERRRIIEEL